LKIFQIRFDKGDSCVAVMGFLEPIRKIMRP